ncbi:MAG: TerD family protein [Clostridia bacterium]|nr:TerD family protein [Clostridia bacterium]
MKDTKVVKAYCEKTKQYYALEVKKYGLSWKVVNMLFLSNEEGKIVSSEVSQDSFETNSNLLSCLKCGSRKVGGCSCSQKHHECSSNMTYTFDCIYCNHLKIDYSMPTRSEVEQLVGKSIKLMQGQEVMIRYSDDRPLNNIYVGVGWDPSKFGASIDVDTSIVVVGNQASELIYYGNKEHPTGCVIHHGDNLTGDSMFNTEDDENISVFLKKVPADRDRLYFVLNVFDCVQRRQTFGMIKNLYIKIFDPDSKKTLIEYYVKGNFNKDTGLIIGVAYKKNGGWMFKAIGQGTKSKTVHDLRSVCASL